MRLKQYHGTISNCLTIRDLPDWLVEECYKSCSFSNPAYIQAKRFSPHGYVSPKILPFLNTAEFDYQNGVLRLPRGFSPKAKLSERGEKVFNRIRWKDERVAIPADFGELPMTLLSGEQKVLVRSIQDCIKSSQRPFGGICFASPTGTGKTIAQALGGAVTGQRTLILCLTNLIRDAWYDDLKLVFGLRRNDVGIIQQKEWQYGNLFTVASVSTLAKHPEHWADVYANFGCVIMDEHHMSTGERIHNFLMGCPAKYLLGASATPKKKELNELVEAKFGSPIKSLIIKTGKTKSSLPLSGVDITDTDFRYDYVPGALDWNDLLDAITIDEDRNALIVEEATSDYRKGHCVMICTPRRAHVELFEAMMRAAGIKDCNVLTGDTNSNRKYTTALRKAVFSGNVRCIIACTAAIRLGANFNPVDRLHLAAPVPNESNLEQLIGRIRRRHDLTKNDCRLHYYLDRNVPYLLRKYTVNAGAVFRRLQTPGYVDSYMA